MIQVEMTLERITKNTFVYVARAEDAINTLYIRKSAYPGGAPEKVTVEVKIK